MAKIIGYILIVIGIFMVEYGTFTKFFIPQIIKSRAKDLNIMHYDGKKDMFVPNDSIILSEGDFYYLQYGTTTNQ